MPNQDKEQHQDKKQLNSYTSGPGKLSEPPPKVATTEPVGPGQLSKPAKLFQPSKEKGQSSSIFTPDKSENYSIRDKAPQDR